MPTFFSHVFTRYEECTSADRFWRLGSLSISFSRNPFEEMASSDSTTSSSSPGSFSRALSESMLNANKGRAPWPPFGLRNGSHQPANGRTVVGLARDTLGVIEWSSADRSMPHFNWTSAKDAAGTSERDTIRMPHETHCL